MVSFLREDVKPVFFGFSGVNLGRHRRYRAGWGAQKGIL
jgi:hypothetical protein